MITSTQVCHYANHGWIGSEYPVEVNSFTNVSSNIASVLIGILIYCLSTASIHLGETELRDACWWCMGQWIGSSNFSVVPISFTFTIPGLFWICLSQTWQIYSSLLQYSYSFWFHSLNACSITYSINARPQRCRDASAIDTEGRNELKSLLFCVIKRGDLEVIAAFAETSVPSVRGVLVHAGVYGDEI